MKKDGLGGDKIQALKWLFLCFAAKGILQCEFCYAVVL